MRHRRKVKYFGVKTAHRKAMFRNMVTSLFLHGRITTTVTRAKELRRLADKLITLAKDGSLHARRQAMSVIMDKAVVAKLFTDIADQMSSRTGGYTRIVRIGPRRGDGAMLCIIELVKESLRPSRPKAARPAGVEEEVQTVIPQAGQGPAEQPVNAESGPAATEAVPEAEAPAESQESKRSALAEPEEPAQEEDEGAASKDVDEALQEEGVSKEAGEKEEQADAVETGETDTDASGGDVKKEDVEDKDKTAD